MIGVQWLGGNWYDMHGRDVRITDLLPDRSTVSKCDDCGAPARYRVNEQPNDDFWYWCGECDIGG